VPYIPDEFKTVNEERLREAVASEADERAYREKAGPSPGGSRK
jgi:hypothetical protein